MRHPYLAIHLAATGYFETGKRLWPNRHIVAALELSIWHLCKSSDVSLGESS